MAGIRCNSDIVFANSTIIDINSDGDDLRGIRRNRKESCAIREGDRPIVEAEV